MAKRGSGSILPPSEADAAAGSADDLAGAGEKLRRSDQQETASRLQYLVQRGLYFARQADAANVFRILDGQPERIRLGTGEFQCAFSSSKSGKVVEGSDEESRTCYIREAVAGRRRFSAEKRPKARPA